VNQRCVTITTKTYQQLVEYLHQQTGSEIYNGAQ